MTVAANTKAQWSVIFDADNWQTLQDHLFPGDRDEHGAVLFAGFAEGRDGPRLLIREVLPALDGVDYVPGQRGYRALNPIFIAGAASRARNEGWSYLAVHCHGGRGSVSFSSVDLASHERGYPSLVQITGRPVGALVLAENAIAGDLWFPDGSRSELRDAKILSHNVLRLFPKPISHSFDSILEFDRQARMFGDAGQNALASMRVGVVGLGGAGSMAADMLARLGVGSLVLIDPDRIESSNLSRIVGSGRSDLEVHAGRLRRHKWRPGAKVSALKVDIAARNISDSGLGTELRLFHTSTNAYGAVESLKHCDWIILAADSQLARLTVNAISHAYLIPATQIGVKIPVDPKSGDVGQIFTVVRRILPHVGCLWCNGLIDPTELQLEVTGEEGVRARAYVGPDAPAPSVIAFNGIAVSMAMSDLLLSTVGLAHQGTKGMSAATYLRFLPREEKLFHDEPRSDMSCPYCGHDLTSLRAKGDAAILPISYSSDGARVVASRKNRRLRLPWTQERA